MNTKTSTLGRYLAFFGVLAVGWVVGRASRTLKLANA